MHIEGEKGRWSIFASSGLNCWLRKSRTPAFEKYRADIDGLRGISVLAVVGFHAFPEHVRGGFIGVDVFFVISGFLITSIILESINRDEFSFAEFYARRIRRIFPALTIVLAACLGIGWFSLLSDEFKQLGLNIASGAGFVANIVYWSEAGYFDTAAETKPLIHLWSLGVEEQFYFIWPVLIWAVSGRRHLLPATIVAVSAASFIANAATVESHPVTAFFLPHTRFWELMSGSSVAWLEVNRIDLIGLITTKACTLMQRLGGDVRAVSRDQAANVVSCLGLGLLAFGIVSISSSFAFPGYWALVPVGGASLMILSGAAAWINRTILSSRLLVFVGLISYPLYLWHWPLLSFARISVGHVPHLNVRLWLVGVSLVLAWLTYSMVEKPIRLDRNRFRGPVFLVALLVIVGASGAYMSRANINVFMGHLNSDYRALQGYNAVHGHAEEALWEKGCFNLSQPASFFDKNACTENSLPGRPRVVLIGDSHSAYLSQYLRAYLASRRYNFSQYSVAYCTPLSLKDKRARCRDINAYIMQKISEVRPDIVVLFAHHSSWATSDDYGENVPYDSYIRDKSADLRAMGARQVLILGQMPTWEDSLPHVLLKRFVLKSLPIPKRTFEGVVSLSLQWDMKMANVSYPDGVLYLSLRNFLCDSTGCLTRVGNNLQTDLIVYDYGHMTKSGAEFVTRNLLGQYLH